MDYFAYISGGVFSRLGVGRFLSYVSRGLVTFIGGLRMARLVCDEPGVLEGVTHYTILGLPGSPVDVMADPDPAVGFSYDLGGLMPGDYTVTANACNDYACSVESEPFTFTILDAPSAPTGLGILLN